MGQKKSLSLPKLPWRLLVSALVGVLVFAGSAAYLRQWVSTHQVTVALPTPARKISAGEVIAAGDLAVRHFVLAARDPAAVANPAEAVGMCSATDLYPGEQIRRDKLVSPQETLHPGEAFVTVRLEKQEQFLGGRLAPNMAVDVVWVSGEKGSPPVLLGSGVVAGVLDESGRPGGDPSKPVPRFAVLRVRKEDAPNFSRPLTGGSVFVIQTGFASPGAPLPAPQAAPPQPQEQAGQPSPGISYQLQ